MSQQRRRKGSPLLFLFYLPPPVFFNKIPEPDVQPVLSWCVSGCEGAQGSGTHFHG